MNNDVNLGIGCVPENSDGKGKNYSGEGFVNLKAAGY